MSECRNLSETKFLLAQHGGGYGLCKYYATLDFELKSSDRYISWGWRSEKKVVRGSPQNRTFRINVKPNAQGKILSYLMALPRYSYWMYGSPVSALFQDYIDQQAEFIQSLDPEIAQLLLLKPSPTDYGWDVEKQIAAKTGFQFPVCSGNHKKLLSKSRLFIGTYNATTFLETFHINFPTILFWNPNYWELNEEAKPYFEEMERVGIFHSTPMSAAKFLNQNLGDIADWWQNSEVQNVKNEFCMEYLHKSANVTKDYVRILRDELSAL